MALCQVSAAAAAADRVSVPSPAHILAVSRGSTAVVALTLTLALEPTQLLHTTPTTTTNHHQQRAELIKRTRDSKDAIIPFKTADFDKFAAGSGRDYHLVFFLNAAYLQGNSQMNLPALRAQFALMAKVG